MTTHGGEGPVPEVPASAWALAWTSLATQLVTLGQLGLRGDDEVSVVVSLLLGGLLVAWVSVGVLRGRMVRLVVAWVVLALSLLGNLALLGGADGPGPLVLALFATAMGVAQVVALFRFCRTGWFAWHRADPPRAVRPSIAPLILVALLVGMLGGLVDRDPGSLGLDVRIGAGDGRAGPVRVAP